MLSKIKKHLYNNKRRKITRKSWKRKWIKERKYVDYIWDIRQVEWWKKKMSIFIRKWVDAFSMRSTRLVVFWQKRIFLIIMICTGRSKTSILGSVFDAESGEKTFKAIVNFFKTLLSKTWFFGNFQFLQYFSIFGIKIIFYLNESYIFGFSASNCVGFHKKIHKKKFARILHCANLT